MQDSVRQFMLVSEQECPTEPTIPRQHILKLRGKLIMEEAFETLTALGLTACIELGDGEFLDIFGVELRHSGTPNLTLIADGIADTHYVLTGTSVACGINEEKVFNEVHRSNMSKCWTSTDVANATRRDAQELHQATVPMEFWYAGQKYVKIGKNKWLVKNQDGKVVKSPSYSAADIASCLT